MKKQKCIVIIFRLVFNKSSNEEKLFFSHSLFLIIREKITKGEKQKKNVICKKLVTFLRLVQFYQNSFYLNFKSKKKYFCKENKKKFSILSKISIVVV